MEEKESAGELSKVTNGKKRDKDEDQSLVSQLR